MSKLATAFDSICQTIDSEIRPLFKGDPLITVLVRFEDNPEQDVLVSSDSIEGIQSLINRSQNRPPQFVRNEDGSVQEP